MQNHVCTVQENYTLGTKQLEKKIENYLLRFDEKNRVHFENTQVLNFCHFTIQSDRKRKQHMIIPAGNLRSMGHLAP